MMNSESASAPTTNSSRTNSLLDGSRSFAGKPFGRWVIVLAITLLFIGVRIFALRGLGMDQFSMWLRECLGIAIMIGTFATAGLGAILLARWIVGAPLRRLFEH